MLGLAQRLALLAQRLALLAQQSGGVTSRHPGQLEVMLHRRSLQDDSKGACQVFNDTSGQYANIRLDDSLGVNCSGWAAMGTCRPDACPAFSVPMNISTRVEPTLWLLAGDARTSDGMWRRLATELNNPPTLFFAKHAPVREGRLGGGGRVWPVAGRAGLEARPRNQSPS